METENSSSSTTSTTSKTRDVLQKIILFLIAIKNLILAFFIAKTAETKESTIINETPAQSLPTRQQRLTNRLSRTQTESVNPSQNVQNEERSPQNQVAVEEDNEDDDEIDEDGDAEGANPSQASSSSRAISKDEKKSMRKQEKKAQRQTRQNIQSNKEEKERLREEKEQAKQLELEMKEEEEKQKAKLMMEEKKKQEKEELDKWASFFEIEESGENITEAEETEAAKQEKENSFLQSFISHIKKEKIVELEDLATEFDITTQSVIERIQTLEKDGKLTGLLDDRGKFIYFSEKDMETVVKIIEKEGRISIEELARKVNDFFGASIPQEESKISANSI